MQRRNFLKKALTAGGLASFLPGISKWSVQNDTETKRQYYELKKYNLKNTDQLKLVNEYLSGKYIPALNKSGINAVGVYQVMDSLDRSALHMLVPYQSVQHFQEVKLGVDAELSDALLKSKYMNTGSDTPAYQRTESSLMIAFEGHPMLKNPSNNTGKSERIYELRIYESYNEHKANKKVEMFNSGEIDIFDKTGLHTVFFGQSFIGDKLPNLTYMLHFESMEERDENWKAFIEHPQWKKMSKDPQYKNTVSNITQVFLKPLTYSQI